MELFLSGVYWATGVAVVLFVCCCVYALCTWPFDLKRDISRLTKDRDWWQEACKEKREEIERLKKGRY